jgi:hypothetical protein
VIATPVYFPRQAVQVRDVVRRDYCSSFGMQRSKRTSDTASQKTDVKIRVFELLTAIVRKGIIFGAWSATHGGLTCLQTIH